MILTTQNLILKPHVASDFEPLARLWGNADFRRYVSPQPMDPETVWLRLLRDIGHWQVFGYGNWAIRQPEDDTLIGSVGLFDYHREVTPRLDAPELGWGLDPAFQGRGYAFEALSAVLSFADSGLKLARTQCMIDEANTPSIRLAQKAGFRFTGEGLYKADTITLWQRLNPQL